jgi:hypothetical protein
MELFLLGWQGRMLPGADASACNKPMLHVYRHWAGASQNQFRQSTWTVRAFESGSLIF